MTDITELAQREKFEAWAEEIGALPWGILKKHRNQDGSYPGPHYTYMWKAWQAASAELVEALEKAQGMEDYWKTQCRGITDHCEVLQARIAELEEAEQKLCAANVTLDARAELAERQLAELGSRSVTVKLPDLRQVVSGDRYVWSDGVFNYSQDVKAELTAKGIKWEAE